ncbi:hypothetical protein BH11CYA1_BH11CYA1_45790 [soil metagenome]
MTLSEDSMIQPQGNQKSEGKPSRLSKEQVIWLNCLLLALFVGRFSLGDYAFANEQLMNFSIAALGMLFVFLSVVVFCGPRSKVRTVSLVLTIPMAIIGLISSCAIARNFVDDQDQVVLVKKAGDVTFELVASYDITYDPICEQWLELRMVRPFFNGLLKETETLIEVRPAEAAKAELIDDGKKIQFTSPALLGRKAIVRTFSTDWVEARKNGYEIIELTKEEQKN